MDPVRVVFFGSDSFSLPTLDWLIVHGRDAQIPAVVVGVVTQPDRPVGRGRKVLQGPVKRRTAEAGTRVFQPVRLRDDAAIREVLAMRPDLLVVASYGQIVPTPLLEEPRHRALNLHPSLLPRYRGSSPIVAPILAGDTMTGTTLIRMSPEMDAGPILSQVSTPIGPDETGGELRDRLAVLSAHLLERSMTPWIEGRIEPAKQDESQATYTRRVEAADLDLDWTQPAVQLARAVRAYAPQPAARTHWRGQPIRVLRSRAIEGEEESGRAHGVGQGGLLVGTGDGVLVVEALQLPGGRAMAAAEAARGHPDLLRATFGRAS